MTKLAATFSFLLLASGMATACYAPMSAGPDGNAGWTPEVDTVSPQSNATYLKRIQDKGNATMCDGYRLAYVLRKLHMNESETVRQLTFAQYRQELIDAQLIDAGWSEDPLRLITQEEVGYLFARAIELKGGVFYSSTGSMRYAHREMIDWGLMAGENPRQFISGPQINSAFRDCKVFVKEAAKDKDKA